MTNQEIKRVRHAVFSKAWSSYSDVAKMLAHIDALNGILADMQQDSEAYRLGRSEGLHAGDTVYVVTSGSYSDYGIRGMFSSREDAQVYIDESVKARDYPDDYNIEEWVLDQEQGKQSTTVYVTWIRADTGEITNREEQKRLVRPGERSLPCGALETFKQRMAEGSQWKPHNLAVQSTVSQEHADKLAVEARQEYLRLRAEYETRQGGNTR